MTIDDLVVYGTAGLLALFIAAVILLYGAYLFVKETVYALAMGNYHFVLLSVTVLILAASAYTATGLWLQKTGRI
jgi:hypothetical protein